MLAALRERASVDGRRRLPSVDDALRIEFTSERLDPGETAWILDAYNSF